MDMEDLPPDKQLHPKNSLPDAHINKEVMWVFAAVAAFWAVIAMLIFW